MQAAHYFDVRLIEIAEGDELVLEYQGRELRLPDYPGSGKRAQAERAEGKTPYGVGRIGVAQYQAATEHHTAFYRFSPYYDQSLRRVFELDTYSTEIVEPFSGNTIELGKNASCIGWRNDSHPEGFLAPMCLIPGENGDFIPDDSEKVEIDVPTEFVDLCNEYRLTPVEVLRGFIADACGLQNFFKNPRADRYSSNGSDERMMASDYLDRAYAMRRAEYDN